MKKAHSMAEAEPTFAKPTETSQRGRVSRWWLGGPLLVGALVVSGHFGWEAWKHHQFEKERTGTPPHVVEDLKLKLLWIPAGTFVMGTEDEAAWLKSLKGKYNEVKPAGWAEWKVKQVYSESPTTVVTLTKGFYLGETEVTQAQWEAVMGNNPSHSKGPNRPVEQVSWKDCVEFCRKLTERERAAGRIEAKQVFRLPTEAEWEYACRAGSSGEWCFGDHEKRLGEFGWYRANSGGETKEVAKLRANSWGFCDMHGNVWEWGEDRYGAYPGGKMSDPTGGAAGFNCVNRGGSAWGVAAYSRCAYRCGLEHGARIDFIGFRLALSSTP